jgi:hypothetical protein
MLQIWLWQRGSLCANPYPAYTMSVQSARIGFVAVLDHQAQCSDRLNLHVKFVDAEQR